MSRIGKKPIELSQGVNVEVRDAVIRVKGPKGELSYSFPEEVKITVVDGKLLVERGSETQEGRALHGLARSLVANMVTGVSQGYTRALEIKGIGYRAQVRGNALSFTLGYSHPVEFQLPQGITASVDEKQTAVTLSGIDKQLLGQVAANIRKLRAPDAYKGKGIRYAGEAIKLKAGKTGKK
ncbi:MAG: 50S ribosomal protein L6 [Nitrospirales bacterium]|nr:50S ribosomal protein L6 [Nitrospirales bacterium]